jgi:flagellar hook protein FlgE
MFGAIYVGLSGLNAYSQGLQQVSNNVTNLNSSGFKGSTVTFTDLVSVSGSGGLSYSGGGDPSGNGVNIGETTLNFKQGELRQTDRDLDLAIDGSGFLMLLRGDEVVYVRTGSFQVDKDGYIVLAGTDYRLATLDSAGKAVSLSIDTSRTSPPTKTTAIKFSDNLSSTATSFSLADVRVYDSTGKAHVWQIQFTKAADATTNQWTVKVTDSTGKVIGEQVLKFNQGIIDPTTNKLVFANDEAGLSVTLDFSQGVTSFSGGSVSTLRAATVDGHGLGTLTSVTVNDKGRVELEMIMSRFPLTLISSPAHQFLNSTFVNVDTLRRGARQPECIIHPADAERRGITPGMRVAIHNDRGAFTAIAKVDVGIREGVVWAPSIWWGKLTEDGANANQTTSQRETDMGHGPVFYDNQVEVSLAD